MKPATPLRLASLGGLALAAVASVWWLGSVRLALRDGADASRDAARALVLAWSLRGAVVLLFALRAGALRGWRHGAAEALAFTAPAWPVVMLASAASSLQWATIATLELLLLAAGTLLPLAGRVLGSALRHRDLADALAMLLGTLLAAALWFTRGVWLPPLA